MMFHGFQCERCCQSFKTKQQYQRHITRKKPCQTVLKETNIDASIPYEDVEEFSIILKGVSVETLIKLLGEDRVIIPDKQIDKQIDKQTDNQVDNQIDKQTDKQTDNQVDKQ